ncbi:MAG TPA: hypothetical protein PK867_06190, partial [Pirellulales bacterium]|nr:hypothetical protein [Pirellulales bacterium]
LIRAADPLPSFVDAAALQAWLVKIAPDLAAIVANIAAALKAHGTVAIELPNGNTVEMQRGPDGAIVMSESHQVMLAASAPVDLPQGRWLDLIRRILPILLQLLPLFLEPAPAPTPAPAPAST